MIRPTYNQHNTGEEVAGGPLHFTNHTVITPSYFPTSTAALATTNGTLPASSHFISASSTRESTISVVAHPEIPKVIKVRYDEVSESEDVRRKGRKGHKKSRGGCFTCKRQKLKCKENKPSCDYCAHRGLRCEWPTLSTINSIKPPPSSSRSSLTTKAKRDAAPTVEAAASFSGTSKRSVVAQHDSTITGRSDGIRRRRIFEAQASRLPVVPRTLQSHDRPPVFSMEDMMLFNHFIQRAYPHHPSGNDSVWKHEIPSLASDYDYLIHSMLALSASELTLQTTCPAGQLKLRSSSLHHRSASISALNKAIQHGVNSPSEGNAMLATIFSLLFQSTFIADGLVEYMTFIRGAIIVSQQMGKQNLGFLFRNLSSALPEPECQSRGGEIEGAPKLDRVVVSEAVESLRRVRELCGTKLERRVWRVLMDAAESLAVSSTQAYLQLRRMYALFAHLMTPSEFHAFTSPSSPSIHTFRILQAHFVALQLVMNPVAAAEVKVSPVVTTAHSSSSPSSSTVLRRGDDAFSYLLNSKGNTPLSSVAGSGISSTNNNSTNTTQKLFIAPPLSTLPSQQQQQAQAQPSTTSSQSNPTTASTAPSSSASKEKPYLTCPVKEEGRAATAGWLPVLHAELDREALETYCVWTRWVEKEVIEGRIIDGTRTRGKCAFKSLGENEEQVEKQVEVEDGLRRGEDCEAHGRRGGRRRWTKKGGEGGENDESGEWKMGGIGGVVDVDVDSHVLGNENENGNGEKETYDIQEERERREERQANGPFIIGQDGNLVTPLTTSVGDGLVGLSACAIVTSGGGFWM